MKKYRYTDEEIDNMIKERYNSNGWYIERTLAINSLDEYKKYVLGSAKERSSLFTALGNRRRKQKKEKNIKFWYNMLGIENLNDFFHKYNLRLDRFGQIRFTDGGEAITREFLKSVIKCLEETFNIEGVKQVKQPRPTVYNLLDFSKVTVKGEENDDEDKET